MCLVDGSTVTGVPTYRACLVDVFDTAISIDMAGYNTALAGLAAVDPEAFGAAFRLRDGGESRFERLTEDPDSPPYVVPDHVGGVYIFPGGFFPRRGYVRAPASLPARFDAFRRVSACRRSCRRWRPPAASDCSSRRSPIRRRTARP